MSDQDDARPAPPLTPEDFYFNEDGLMVLTETYLRKRGFCCQSGCKHCPYGFHREETPSDEAKDKSS